MLSGRIVQLRIQNEQFVGEDLPESKRDAKKQHQALTIANRCHANFMENVPIAFIFAAVAELNGANKKTLSYGLAVLLALRIVHAEFGLKGKSDAVGWGRPVGYFGTAGWLAGFAAYSTYLVRGYWGY